MPVHIVDIASGHGRYVLDALDGAPSPPDSVLLRDYSDLNVNQGSALIRAKGLQQIVRFVRGDAFNRASLAAITPRPTVGIVSGLYELFAEKLAAHPELPARARRPSPPTLSPAPSRRGPAPVRERASAPLGSPEWGAAGAVGRLASCLRPALKMQTAREAAPISLALSSTPAPRSRQCFTSV